MAGMKIGSKHNWDYKEKGYKSKGQNFTIYQSKGRNTPAPYGTGMKTGSKLIWKINGVEKVGQPRYVNGYGIMTPITIRGTKFQRGYKTPKMKRFRITKKKRKRGYRGTRHYKKRR